MNRESPNMPISIALVALFSRTGIVPVAGASSPSFVRGQDAREDRLEARPPTP